MSFLLRGKLMLCVLQGFCSVRTGQMAMLGVSRYILGALFFCGLTASVSAQVVSGIEEYSAVESLVAETHQRSLEFRSQDRERTLSRQSWPDGVWGDTTWSLVALYQNEKVDEANARLLRNTLPYVAAMSGRDGSAFKPENFSKLSPWAYFALPDYVRILVLFRKESPYFSGRLTPEVESAMKAALWAWVKGRSRVADASLGNIPVLLGTENHDLTLRPSYYLLAAVFKDDPDYQNLHYNDGGAPSEHFEAYNAFYKKWARWRASHGLWAELGSDGYQKYSYPGLFNLADLSPDPVVRKQFTMLLDLAFIEEAQVSVHGRRGGGRSRASYGDNNFEAYKNLLYADPDLPAGSSHSSVIETSEYQLPTAAIVLRYLEFPVDEPFVVQSRVLGELEEGEERRLSADSALVNYAYRTPHLILGSTLQDPSLSMAGDVAGVEVLKYAGFSRQKRWSGIIFDDADRDAIYPIFEPRPGGRPQHSFWGVQHKNVLMIQRIVPQKNKMGSYNTGWIGIKFDGKHFIRIERDGWIFAAKGEGYAVVCFLDSGYDWDESREVAIPQDHVFETSTSRVIFITGGLKSDGSFAEFQDGVLASTLNISDAKVTFRGGVDGAQIDFFKFDPWNVSNFKQPEVNGQPIELRSEWTYSSPYLRARFGDEKVYVKVGPVRTTFDFAASTEETVIER